MTKTWLDENFRWVIKFFFLATLKPNKLAVQRRGPGIIESQLSDTNYIVKMTTYRKDNGKITGAHLTIKPSKGTFAQNHTKYLGHIFGSGVRTPAEAKIKAVADFPKTTTKTHIRTFLGLAGNYANYIKKFCYRSPFNERLKGENKERNFSLDRRMQSSIRRTDTKAKPTAAAPGYEREFIIKMGASVLGMGVVMSQLDSKNEEYPILYCSKKSSDAERKYSTTERESAWKINAIEN
ncbi:hypothetical protein AVEN_102149-1 [Araneus ventricosus]|uniref:Reverse transcriptase/retrotransposon-derived protein RNase H-like domain-containing protein n=1 Tax=Araneus ventricosus TaxID=182803 RepID=A0A4Y2LLE3_ARAVE|nr:hypothetical protein AVEN_102149-1 [Araneus ventricosus]